MSMQTYRFHTLFPIELIHCIFAALSDDKESKLACLRVRRDWRKIIFASSKAWCDLRMDDIDEDRDERIVPVASLIAPNVQHLTLATSSNVYPKLIKALTLGYSDTIQSFEITSNHYYPLGLLYFSGHNQMTRITLQCRPTNWKQLDKLQTGYIE
ncbi:hypothetical protein BDA99DRAFT_559507 [Phascolomyces articulosus]|uniref:F-box domain-containing protein n=1 Tax=Phascolomyces articulosus TaxID=60185 RepID=A0AAD5KEN8_9FUNG|nr:hypothetical protein BDA99DRAFT_559507 [Phascolomyces articulosus]